jgi:hypothetical protein
MRLYNNDTSFVSSVRSFLAGGRAIDGSTALHFSPGGQHKGGN